MVYYKVDYKLKKKKKKGDASLLMSNPCAE